MFLRKNKKCFENFQIIVVTKYCNYCNDTMLTVSIYSYKTNVNVENC